MAAGEFEYESFRILQARGHQPVRLTASDLRRRFPGWKAQRYVDGFFDPKGGYAESARVVKRLRELASQEGVKILEGIACRAFLEAGSRITGILTDREDRLTAERVVVAAGAWTLKLLPHLTDTLRVTGHPVYHFKPPNTRLYQSGLFPVFTADISRTGWYGFPLSREGVVKVARHGPGRSVDPDGERRATPEEEADLRAFLLETFPTLAPLPVVEERICLYCDTPDQHFWIDQDRHRPELVVAAGGSGHGFKFAPVLGRFIADAVEGKSTPQGERFRARPLTQNEQGQEQARYRV